MKNIAIFASGSGSNAENLIRYFSAHPQGTVRLVLSNKAEAGAIERAARLGVESMVFDRDTFYNSEQVLARLRQERIDFVVLAGFLWLVPDYLIAAYPDRIVNIHPALLPSFQGAHAIQDAFDYGVKVTGVTVHFANSDYDCGPIIAQRPVEVEEGWTVDQLEARIHEVEHEIYPHVAQLLAEGRVHVREDGHVAIVQA